MTFRFVTFASGSSGNSYLIQSEHNNMLLDTGIAGKRIIQGMVDVGSTTEKLSGIFLTHEHTDHVKSIRMISRKAPLATVYGSRGTLDSVADKVSQERMSVIRGGDDIDMGDVQVSAFSLSHDASEPVGYSFAKNNRRITVITDTGVVCEHMYPYICDSDLLVLEANHEKNILMMGNYPYSLKKRITGKFGHISNVDAGRCICRMLQERSKAEIPTVYLAHLSRENNTPLQAELTVKNELFEAGFMPGRDLNLGVFARDEKGPVIEI